MKLIKKFEASEDNRSRISLGSGTRLNPEMAGLELKSGEVAGIVRFWKTDPESARSWLVIDQAAEVGGGAIAFRLGNGASDFWWDGAAWAAPDADDWNTLAEIQAGLASWPHRALLPVIRLSRPDAAAATPSLKALLFLFDADEVFQEDYLRSLIRRFSGLRYLSTVRIKATATTTANVGSGVLAVVAVYNLTTDPTRRVNLYGAYNPLTGVVTLSAPVVVGNALEIRGQREAPVHLDTSSDYSEQAKAPFLLIQNVENRNLLQAVVSDVVRAGGSGWNYRRGYQEDIEFDLVWTAETDPDSAAIYQAILEQFRGSPFLVAVGQDERFAFETLLATSRTARAGLNGALGGVIRGRIGGAVYYPNGAEQTPLTQRLVVSGNRLNVTVE